MAGSWLALVTAGEGKIKTLQLRGTDQAPSRVALREFIWRPLPGDPPLGLPALPSASPTCCIPAAHLPQFTSWRKTEPALIQEVCRDRDKGVAPAEAPRKCLGRAPSCGRDAGWLWEQGSLNSLLAPPLAPSTCPGASLRVTVSPTC